jgi:hypothetical protein
VSYCYVSGSGLVFACKPGWEGDRCQHHQDSCPPLDQDGVDSNWDDVTIGHLLSHMSGIPGDAPGFASVVMPNVGKFREIEPGDSTTCDFWEDLESGVWKDHGDAFLDARRFQMKQALDTLTGGSYDPSSIFFVPHLPVPPYPGVVDTSNDFFTANAGRCLESPPGTKWHYSNGGYEMLGAIGAYLYPGSNGRLTSYPGDPDTYEDTALDLFLEEQLLIDGPDEVSQGIMLVHNTVADPFSDPADRANPSPIPRFWVEYPDYYYDKKLDRKRPYCVYYAPTQSCRFDHWQDFELSTTFAWSWAFERVLQKFSGAAAPAGAHQLSANGCSYLRFLAKYKPYGDQNKGEYHEDPPIGERRHGEWTYAGGRTPVGTAAPLPESRPGACTSRGTGTTTTLPAIHSVTLQAASAESRGASSRLSSRASRRSTQTATSTTSTCCRLRQSKSCCRTASISSSQSTRARTPSASRAALVETAAATTTRSTISSSTRSRRSTGPRSML